MKKPTFLLTLFSLLTFLIACQVKQQKSPYIDLPEEITEAVTGDVLVVERHVKDTIFITFKNYRSFDGKLKTENILNSK